MSEPEHWNYERILHESDWEPDVDFYSIPNMNDELLDVFSKICEAPDVQPEYCLPCAAMVEAMQRNGVEVEPEDDIEEYETPELDRLVAEHSPFEETPVAERFAAQVHALEVLVEEMLEGPPIPPPNVSQEELALLVVAAQRWIALMEAQGLDLAPPQAAILHATKALVSRLHRG